MKTKVIPLIVSGILTTGLFSCESETINRRIESPVINQGSAVTDATLVQTKKGRKIKVAILLDTSGSMGGLIEQTKNQLWKIVMELAKSKDVDGLDPDIELALYHYGNSSLSITKGYVQMIQAFTGELDEISEKLFALTTSGGDEYCGAVINTSLSELEWSNNPDDLQVIYIAGNEEFNQGGIGYESACAVAKNKNVIVNTIFCGKRSEGINTFWKHAADLTGGNFASINSDAKTVHYESPYDAQISNLNVELNSTYVSFNKIGIEKKAKQIKEDQNASFYGSGNATKRYLSKSSKVYKNSSWDLVDASKKKGFKVEEINKVHLPDSLSLLTTTELQVRIHELAGKRTAIKKEMSSLNKQREAFVNSEKAKVAKSDTNMLDDVMIKGLREQAGEKSFTFQSEIN